MHEPPRRRIFDASFAFLLVIAVVGGTAVWLTRGASAFWDLVVTDLGFAIILLPKVSAGVLIASALPLLIPRERVIKTIGAQSGVRGLAIAAMAGALLPGGPSATLPLVASLLISGADAGAAVAMVSAWMLFGLNRTLIWELSFLPADLVGLRVLLCLPVPVLLGLLFRALSIRFEVPR